MRVIKRVLGVLMAFAIVCTSMGTAEMTALAKDLGDSSYYCEEALVQRLFAIDAENEEINKMLDRDRGMVIGILLPDGTRDGTAQTKYWIAESTALAFWDASARYMWGDTAQGITGKVQAWDAAGLLGDADSNGPNWTSDGAYLTSISRREMLEVINAMDAVLQPFRELLKPAGTSPLTDESVQPKKETHVHNWVEVTVQEATATTDKIITEQCSICGQQQSHKVILGTAVGQFIKDCVQKLEKAPANGSVTLDTGIWTCFNRTMLEALKSRQDVTVTVNFKYQGDKYTFTIPAQYGDAQLDGLLDENGYCGFMYLLSVFDGQKVTQ